MVHSLSWLAVHGKVTHLILDEMRLRPTGEREKTPSSLSGADLPAGWYVVVKDQSVELIRDALLKEISLQCECVACFVEDTSKTTSAVGWKNGRKLWSALHDGAKGKDHILLRGEFPALFGPLLESAKTRQKADPSGEFMLQLPVELAKELTGYRHDQPIASPDAQPFEILKLVVEKPGKKK